MVGGDILGKTSTSGGKSMKPFQIPNWNRSATVLEVIHYSSLVKSVNNIIILQICCVIEI